MPGTALSTLVVLIHFISTTTKSVSSIVMEVFPVRELMGRERTVGFFEVTNQVKRRVRIKLTLAPGFHSLDCHILLPLQLTWELIRSD